MKIISEKSFKQFQPWAGAVDTFDRIIREDKADEMEAHIEELYPDGITDTQLNDLLWFDEESVFEWLGIKEDEE